MCKIRLIEWRSDTNIYRKLKDNILDRLFKIKLISKLYQLLYKKKEINY